MKAFEKDCQVIDLFTPFDFKHTLDNCKLGLPDTMKWLEDNYHSMYSEDELSLAGDFSQEILDIPVLHHPEYNFEGELNQHLF